MYIIRIIRTLHFNLAYLKTQFYICLENGELIYQNLVLFYCKPPFPFFLMPQNTSTEVLLIMWHCDITLSQNQPMKLKIRHYTLMSPLRQLLLFIFRQFPNLTSPDSTFQSRLTSQYAVIGSQTSESPHMLNRYEMNLCFFIKNNNKNFPPYHLSHLYFYHKVPLRPDLFHKRNLPR